MLVAVLCGALVVASASDLALPVRGGHPVDTVLEGNHSTDTDTSLVDTIRVIEELNRSRERRVKKRFALKLCVFATVIGYIANSIIEASRAGSVYVVLSKLGKEACSLVFANETKRGDMEYQPHHGYGCGTHRFWPDKTGVRIVALGQCVPASPTKDIGTTILRGRTG